LFRCLCPATDDDVTILVSGIKLFKYIYLMNKYNNPSIATMFPRALLNTYITTCLGLNPSHHQVLSYTEY
jgi:hypothetical protein